MHDKAVSQDGTYDRAVAAIKEAKRRGFRVSVNCTLFDGAEPERVAKFFDSVMAMGVDGIMTSPGYAYERAPDQAHFLSRQKTKQLFRDILKNGRGKGWKFTQSPLFMNFLAGNENYRCTPWGKPTRNVFGWQRPCYLLGEGYAKTFQELMDSTDWDKYGTGAYEKCADCMVHSGYESTAVMDAVASPLKTIRIAMKGPKPRRRHGPRDRPLAAAPGRVRLQPSRSEQDGRTPPQEAQQGAGRRRRRLIAPSSLKPSPPGRGLGEGLPPIRSHSNLP